MELLKQISNTQFLFPAAAVAVVLICAALVFVFGFHTAEQPQFDKLPLVLDDRKSSSKKKKIKDKKSSPNRTANEDVKNKSESSKKSPSKEKKEEKAKDEPKPKPEPKPARREFNEPKKNKKKATLEVEKPADFDDGGWQEVPKKSDKKKPKAEEKKESPVKKSNKKKSKEVDVEAGQSGERIVEESFKVVSAEGPGVDAAALQAQVEELQRVLKEAERRDQGLLAENEVTPEPEELSEVKDLRSNKKKENKEKQNKKKTNEAVTKSAPKVEASEDSGSSDKQEESNAPVFDELADTWTDAKASKKGKKKARKDQ